ncbi:MAG: mechanosensitive ion channel family protein [Parvularculaceae bacterium]
MNDLWRQILDQLSGFASEFGAVANAYLFSETGFRLLAALAIAAFFFLMRRIMAHFIVNRLKALAKRTKTNFDDLVLNSLEQPFTFVPVAFGVYVAANILNLDGPNAEAANRLVQSLIAFTIFWTLYRLVSPLAYLLQPLSRTFSEALVDWLMRGLRAFAVFLGVVAILTIWGIPVMPILASFSLLSVAVALGAQDLFKNLIAGAAVIAERRFKPGDWVKVEGVVEGVVEQINFRSTRIRRFDKAPVHVPNAKLSDDVVTNFSEMTQRRIYWTIALEYRTTLDQLRAIRNGIEAYLKDNPEFEQPPVTPLFVRIDSFNDSSIDLMVYCFTKTTNWGEWLEIKEDLACAIKRIVEEAGAGFAFPSRSLYIENEVELASPAEPPHAGQPEAFAPPASG